MVVVATLGEDLACNWLQSACGKRKAQIICKEQGSVGSFPSCQSMTVHKVKSQVVEGREGKVWGREVRT